MFQVDIKSSTGVVYVSVVISNVLGGCPVSLGVIKAAGVRGVSESGMAFTGHYPLGHQGGEPLRFGFYGIPFSWALSFNPNVQIKILS